MVSKPRHRSVGGVRHLVCRLVMPLLVGVMSGSCDSPVQSPSTSVFQAMAPDGRHVVIGFPDVIDVPSSSLTMEVTQEGTPVPLAIDSLTRDTLSGTLLRIRLAAGYSLASTLYITFSGVRYARGEAVSVGPVDMVIPAGVRYERDMAPFFEQHCNACHGSAVASGNYRTDSRAALYAFGSDADRLERSPNLIPGNVRCQLAVKTGFRGREFRRAGLTAFDAELVRQWILYGDASDLPDSSSIRLINAQVADFIHLRIGFARKPDSAGAGDVGRYRVLDMDQPGEVLAPVAVHVDTEHGTIVTLELPQQQLFHHYRVTVTGLTDPYGDLLIDSVSADYRALISHEADIAPLFQQRCARCHNAGVPDSLRGYYRTDSYAALFAYGSDSLGASRSRNLIPTKSNCLLVVKTRQRNGKTGRCALRAPLTPMESRLIEDWVVSYFARPF